MARLFVKLLALITVILGIKTALWFYLHTYKTKRFNESGYKLDSMLHPIRHRINTVFVGSSRTAHSFNPAVFDSVTHGQTNSFNHGVSALFAPGTFAECEKLLQMEDLNLRTIIMELSFPPESTHEDPFSRSHVFREIGFKTRSYWHETYQGAPSVRKGNTLYDSYLHHFFMLRSSVFMTALTLLRKEQENFIMTPSGYRYFRPNAFPTRQPVNLPPDTVTAPVQITSKERFYVAQLLNLARQCEARNVSIYFHLPNRLMGEEKQMLPNVYAALPERYRIAVPYRREYTQPFPANCSDDQQHLNESAATLYTRFFAQAFLQKRKTASP